MSMKKYPHLCTSQQNWVIQQKIISRIDEYIEQQRKQKAQNESKIFGTK